MATTKNQAVRLGRVESSSDELNLYGLLVEEIIDGDVNLKIDVKDDESGDVLRRDE